MRAIKEHKLLENCPGLQTPFGINSNQASPDLQTVDSGISLGHASALYEFVKKTKPKTILEVGMANGISAVAMLQALRENGSGELISIDPYQNSDWGGRGLKLIKECGLAGIHRLIEEPDYLALPRLLEAKQELDFAYIDGWHTFDYTLVDFWYIDKMLNINGTVAFNDCDMRAVSKVIGFLKTHRNYEEDMVLKRRYKSSNFAKTIIRMALGLCTNDRYFRKNSNFAPSWDFFKNF